MNEEQRRVEQATMFGNRLAKNARARRRWAKREQVSCYRLYDRDIPEVPLTLDWYEGQLQISHSLALPREHHRTWLPTMVAVARDRLGVGVGDVFIKERRRQSGANQYQALATDGQRIAVSEGGLRFWINLSDYLDTGLFLDHRRTRARVAQLAQQKKMLNLFSYTASFSVYAAAHGAIETTSVDMSKTYTRWAEDNFELNELASPSHRFIAQDVFAFLREARSSRELYDVVVVDPPIFSNSKRMSSSFDVQRDHVELLANTRAVCHSGSDVVFSTARRKFKFDFEQVLSIGFEAIEITAETISFDFRQRRPHRCFALCAVGG